MFQRLFNMFRRDLIVKPKIVMDPADKDIIRRFAAGDDSLREKAIEIHCYYIPILGVRETLEMEFMAEVDHPHRDYTMINLYRDRIVELMLEESNV